MAMCTIEHQKELFTAASLSTVVLVSMIHHICVLDMASLRTVAQLCVSAIRSCKRISHAQN